MGRALSIQHLPPDWMGEAWKAAGGLAPIAAAALAGELRVPGFAFARGIEDVPQPSERFPSEARETLASALEAGLAPYEPPVRVLDSVRALRQAGACAVVTGQQPGLLAAPLYSLYKALHCVRLARSLEQAWETPVVPVFWNHADDHDVAEVNHAWVPNENLDLTRVALAGLASSRMPIARIVLDEERQRLGAIRSLLAQAFERCAHGEEAVELLAPRGGDTLATAFTRVLLRLLGHLGLVVLEPDWIRAGLSRALLELVRLRPLEPLLAGARDLRDAGFEPAIAPEEAPFLYRVDAGGRRPLRMGGEGFRYDGEEGGRTAEELAAEIVRDPEGWSPAALSRPLAQDRCLPVAAYLGGRGELAYHAQLGALRRAAGLEATPFALRLSCTLVEPDVRASLARLSTTAEQVLRSRGAPAEGDPELPEALQRLRAAGARAAELILAQRPDVSAFDRALGQNLARAADQVRSLVEKLVEKGERVHQNSAGTGRRAVRRVENALVPRGEPQERVLGPVSFLARHGTAWIDELFAATSAFPAGHALAFFEDGGEKAPPAGRTSEDTP